MRKALVCVLFLTGCSFTCTKMQAGQRDTTSATNTYSYFKANVIPNCLRCHSTGAQYDFSSYESLMSSDLVLPGNHEGSSLWNQLNSGAMPLGGAKLDQDLIDSTAAWIDANANND